jgi:hypothetical protein
MQRNCQDHRHINSLYNKHWNKIWRKVHEMKKKRGFNLKNVLEADYILVTMDRALIVIATGLEKVDDSADNFSFLYILKKFEEIKKRHIENAVYECARFHI